MKKLIIVAFLLCFTLCGCNSDNGNSANKTALDPKSTNETTSSANSEIFDDTGEIIEVAEAAYVTSINEIYTNYKKYEGQTIRIEGMFSSEVGETTTYYYVYRTGPGCCGNDGAMCGFEFTTSDKLPEPSDWIRVTGKLDSYEENGRIFLTLSESNVEIMDDSQRGAEIVQ